MDNLEVTMVSTLAEPIGSGAYAGLDPDVQLMLAVRAGDAGAFEELVRRYQGRLFTVMRHMIDRPDQLEDLVQEVFLRVFRSRNDYVPSARFATWIYRIAENIAKNAKRTLARRKEVHVRSQPQDSQAVPCLEELAKDASAMMPTRRVEGNERSLVVQEALRSLGERQRMALLLCKFEGMSYADVAEAMEITVPAVKSLLARARLTLRDLLEPYFLDGSRATPVGEGMTEP
ncbi:MAG TPA: sigma-70 family RNA polymerase sigma factor [Pirellulaceae bacterium]